MNHHSRRNATGFCGCPANIGYTRLFRLAGFLNHKKSYFDTCPFWELRAGILVEKRLITIAYARGELFLTGEVL
jgi:hypothetical protein